MSMGQHHARRSARIVPRRAAVAAEFIMVLPLLIMLCIAAADLGQYAFVALALENAVKAGAERGATRQVTPFTFDAWQATVEQGVQEDLADLPQSCRETLEVVVVAEPTDTLPRTTVYASCQFRTTIQWWLIPNSLEIRRSISVRQYR